MDRKEEKYCEEQTTANEGCEELKDCSHRGNVSSWRTLLFHSTHIIQVCGESACLKKWSSILARSEVPLCKDQAHDTFMSYLTLEIDCNCMPLLDDSAPLGFESVFVGFNETDVCQQSFHPCHECDLASNRNPSAVRSSSAPTNQQQPLCLSKLLPDLLLS